jgi:hypothetical protein
VVAGDERRESAGLMQGVDGDESSKYVSIIADSSLVTTQRVDEAHAVSMPRMNKERRRRRLQQVASVRTQEVSSSEPRKYAHTNDRK